MDYEKEAYLYLLFHYTGKKDVQETTPKIQTLMFGLAQTSHFGLWGIIPLPESQLAFHICYVKYKNTLIVRKKIRKRRLFKKVQAFCEEKVLGYPLGVF